MKCFKCKTKYNIPNSYYVGCSNIDACVKGHQTGIDNGWFNWPHSFDPVWLLECDGFMEDQK